MWTSTASLFLTNNGCGTHLASTIRRLFFQPPDLLGETVFAKSKIAPTQNLTQKNKYKEIKTAIKSRIQLKKWNLSQFVRTYLSSFNPAVRVGPMKTSHTLIQLRQHRSLCLVSARLPG
jgi:hypothetical protein